jgi:hypothetical protein
MSTDVDVEADAIFREVIEPLIESARARGYREALKDTADGWQFGGWTELTSVRVPAGGIPALAYGQVVSDWLRARACR